MMKNISKYTQGELNMELGIISGYDENSFKIAAENKLSFLEFTINIDHNTEEFFCALGEIKGFITKYGVMVQSIGRWGTDRINQNGTLVEDELQISYKLIDAASFLGCPNFVCGCNYINSLSYYENCTLAISYFEKLLEYSQTKGVKISSYNCRWNNFVVDPMSWTLIHGHLKELGIKFDSSHSIYNGGDYLKEMRDWGDRFNHVHIKGSLVIDGQRFDDPPAGLDGTNWGAFMNILYAKNYEGGLSIEPHSSYWKGELGDKGVNYTIQYIKKLLL